MFDSTFNQLWQLKLQLRKKSQICQSRVRPYVLSSSEPIDDYAKDGGKELFYQDALRSNYESLTIL